MALAQQKPAPSLQPRAVLLHSAELILKGKNRRYFEQQLVKNIRISLQDAFPFRYERIGASFLLQFEQSVEEEILNRLQRIFGVASFAPVFETEPTMEQLEQAVLGTFPESFSGSFAVNARRSGKSLPFRSIEINKRLGHVIQEAHSLPVDLSHPDLTLSVQATAEKIYFSWESFAGKRGLPVGVSGKVIVLLSGGIDSPVAAYRMASRGCQPIYVHFHSAPYTNRASLEKVGEIIKVLDQFHYISKLYLVPFAELQQELVRKCPAPLRVILYRRFMLRIAARIARYEKAAALVTGESVGQVASQTLANIRSIEAVTPLPVLRPLVGCDKQEIVDCAREIGTYSISIEPDQDCCSYLMPPKPATHTQPLQLEMAEAELEVEALVRQALRATERKSQDKVHLPFAKEE